MSKSYAYFAGGCFWGVEYYFNKQEGVLGAKSGFMGGGLKDPTYQDVCTKTSGHLEVVQVSYDPSVISYENLAKVFFEIHDPTQEDGQGPDIGPQYLSAVFISNDKERKTIESLIEILENKNYKIATKILDAEEFYEAEEFHQTYYQKTGKTPYCHSYTKRF